VTSNNLREIIHSLRERLTTGRLGAGIVTSMTGMLAAAGYEYDVARFPALPSNHAWPTDLQDAPQSLAEALLWKMGKWEVYRSFVGYVADANSAPKTTDVVFYAFAKHLANSSRPIYDQHALRALWAIDSGMTHGQIGLCRSLLATRDGKWKASASGASTSEGYQLYLDRVERIRDESLTLDALDKLLMPLGQALKQHTADRADKERTTHITEFNRLAGLAE